MQSFLRGIDGVNKVVTLAVGGLLMMVAVAVFFQVLVRFVLTALGINISAPWTEELARYALIWMVFLGAAVGVRHARMISLEFVVRAVPDRLGVTLRYGVMALSVVFFAMLIWVGHQFVMLGQTETSPVMGIRKDLVYWAMPIGMGLMILNSIALVIETVREGRDIRYAADHAPEM